MPRRGAQHHHGPREGAGEEGSLQCGFQRGPEHRSRRGEASRKAVTARTTDRANGGQVSRDRRLGGGLTGIGQRGGQFFLGADGTSVQKLGEQMAAGVSGHRCKIMHNNAKLCKLVSTNFCQISPGELSETSGSGTDPDSVGYLGLAKVANDV